MRDPYARVHRRRLAAVLCRPASARAERHEVAGGAHPVASARLAGSRRVASARNVESAERVARAIGIGAASRSYAAGVRGCRIGVERARVFRRAADRHERQNESPDCTRKEAHGSTSKRSGAESMPRGRQRRAPSPTCDFAGKIAGFRHTQRISRTARARARVARSGTREVCLTAAASVIGGIRRGLSHYR